MESAISRLTCSILPIAPNCYRTSQASSMVTEPLSLPPLPVIVLEFDEDSLLDADGAHNLLTDFPQPRPERALGQVRWRAEDGTLPPRSGSRCRGRGTGRGEPGTQTLCWSRSPARTRWCTSSPSSISPLWIPPSLLEIVTGMRTAKNQKTSLVHKRRLECTMHGGLAIDSADSSVLSENVAGLVNDH